MEGVQFDPVVDTFVVQDSDDGWAQTTTDADAYVEAGTEADAEFFDKIGKFADVAYKKLSPPLAKMKRFGGPRAKDMLSMTPVGQLAGMGPPGNNMRSRQRQERHSENVQHVHSHMNPQRRMMGHQMHGMNQMGMGMGMGMSPYG